MHGRGHGPMASKCPPRELSPEGPRGIGGEVRGEGAASPGHKLILGVFTNQVDTGITGYHWYLQPRKRSLPGYETGGRAKLGGGLCLPAL